MTAAGETEAGQAAENAGETPSSSEETEGEA